MSVETWVEVGTVAELQRRQRLVVSSQPDDIVVWWYEGAPRALRNICIHDDRALAGGSLLGNRVVCPGHQWAFELETGYCKERDRHQPIFVTKVENDVVYVDVSRPIEPQEPSR